MPGLRTRRRWRSSNGCSACRSPCCESDRASCPANFFRLLAKENRVGMRGPECHPWAEKILTGACEWRKFLGAIGRRLRRQGLRAGHRRRESEGQKDKHINAFRWCGAQRSSIRRTPVGGRPPGRRQHTAGNRPGVRTSRSGGSRSDCAGATEAGHAWCRGSAGGFRSSCRGRLFCSGYLLTSECASSAAR